MDYKQALFKAAALCSQQERCTSDIRKKLLNWELSDTDCEKALAYLHQEKYLDDQRFANYFVRDKFRFNGWGRIKIKYQLRQKEISGDIADKAIEQIDTDEYLKKLAELLHAKNRQIKNKDLWKTKSSLARFAQSRGYEPHLVFSCIDKIMNCNNEDINH